MAIGFRAQGRERGAGQPARGFGGGIQVQAKIFKTRGTDSAGRGGGRTFWGRSAGGRMRGERSVGSVDSIGYLRGRRAATVVAASASDWDSTGGSMGRSAAAELGFLR